LIMDNPRNQLRHKVEQLPLKLKDFLGMPEIVKELNMIYPELMEIDQKVQGHDIISVVLTESWHDGIPNRNQYMNQFFEKVSASVNKANSPIFIKQHPGEKLPIETNSNQIEVLPKKLPIELLYLVMLSNKIQKVNLYSFGSTAILNIYDLCRNDENLDIYLISSMTMTSDFKITFQRFCELATNYQVRFKTV
jgi:hypothetical protein